MNQLRARPCIVPELAPGCKSRRPSPANHPCHAQSHGHHHRQIGQPGQQQRGRKPQARKHKTFQCQRLCQRLAVLIQHPDAPCFHGQGLSLVPKPSEVKRQHQPHKNLQSQSVGQAVSALAQGAEQVGCNEGHSKEQHAFVQPARHAPKQGGGGKGGIGHRWRQRRGGHSLWVGELGAAAVCAEWGNKVAAVAAPTGGVGEVAASLVFSSALKDW